MQLQETAQKQERAFRRDAAALGKRSYNKRMIEMFNESTVVENLIVQLQPVA